MSCTLGDGVWPCQDVRLSITATPWALAAHAHRAIEEHWARAVERNPRYFNGTVFVLRSASLSAGLLQAEVAAVEFKAFLYWRDDPGRDPDARDVFGSAVVVSADGAVLLGEQGAGQLSTGLAYPPGGLIDPRDARPDGTIDIRASICRELAEETGLGRGEDGLVAEPGYLVTVAGPHVSLGIVFRARETAIDLERRVAAFIAADRDPELVRVHLVASREAAAAVPSPPHVQPLLAHLLARH